MAEAFFTDTEQQQIIAAIQHAEKQTSGEIRVHIEPECKGDPYDRAQEVFTKLGMHATAQKNGVLFYVAYTDKKLAVLGDQGIHEKVTQDFWEEEKELMTANFKTGHYCDGLCIAIQKAGEKLKAYFPHDSENDQDELSNDISFDGGGHA